MNRMTSCYENWEEFPVMVSFYFKKKLLNNFIIPAQARSQICVNNFDKVKIEKFTKARREKLLNKEREKL